MSLRASAMLLLYRMGRIQADAVRQAVEDGILIVTPTSSAVACIQGNPNAFRVCFNDAAQGTAAADYIADNNLGTKIAVFYQSDIDYSAGLYETFQTEAAARGLEIVEEQTFTAGSATDPAVLRRVKETVGDVVVLANTGCRRDTIEGLLNIADGAVVGTTFKYDGKFENQVDKARVRDFMEKVRDCRGK